ncbi:MAG: SIR2 family protein [Spirochaetia bacterium]
MLEAMIALSFAVYSSPGVYALLLGSGVSRSAGIPTGWEIVKDLTTKFAMLCGEDAKGDPLAWYRARENKEPDYSELVQEFAKTPADRRELLRSYFEPTTDEKSRGIKTPTRAHKAIASLVADGYIRIILSTNFDRLMETALQNAGVTPVIIGTPDATKGVPPLAHLRCAVIKIHGDYLDTRIKNTPSELAQYDKRTNILLDQILDQYGLIVCGWSAQWDTALRDAISRQRSRRYSLFWAAQRPVEGLAADLLSSVGGQHIISKDADSLFEDLTEKIHRLAEVAAARHPISPVLAIASVKRYIADSPPRILLHDLVHDECEKLYSGISEAHFPATPGFSDQELLRRVNNYEQQSEILRAILITGCYWGQKDDTSLWIKTIERIANVPGYQNGLTVWINLSRYPALILLYSAGLAMIAAQNLVALSALFSFPRIILNINAIRVMEQSVGQRLPGKERHYTPTSEHLFELLRDPLREYLPDDIDYQSTFDRFEYLLGLAFADLSGDSSWGPIGCFAWREQHFRREAPVIVAVGLEAEKEGDDWPFLSKTLFDTSISRFREVKIGYDAFLQKARSQMM